MSEPKEYKMKSIIEEDTEGQARLLLYSLLYNHVLEFRLYDGGMIEGTSNPDIAGSRCEEFNTFEEFHLFDLDEREWISLRYEDVESMEISDRLG